MARKTPIAPVLTLHRGGLGPANPAEIEQAQRDARDAVLRLGLVLPDSESSERIRKVLLDFAAILADCDLVSCWSPCSSSG
jgi:hypothetical protein